MSEGAAKEYEFSQKNNWRRQVWKWAAKRVNPSRAKVLIFSGASCLDIPAMRFQGFLPANITSIEADAKAAKQARSTYPILVFKGTSREFLEYAPGDMKYDIIFFDYCGGMTMDRMVDLEFAFNRLNDRGILGANFLRGRDDFLEINKGREALFEAHGRHRGKWASLFLAQSIEYGYRKYLNAARKKARTAWYYDTKDYTGKGLVSILGERDDVGSSVSLAAEILRRWEDWRCKPHTTEGGFEINAQVAAGAKMTLESLSGKTDSELLNHPCVLSALKAQPNEGEGKTFSYRSGPVYMDSFLRVVKKNGFAMEIVGSCVGSVMETWVKKHIEWDGVGVVRKKRFEGENSWILNEAKRRVLRGMIDVPRALAAAKAVQSKSRS